VAAAPTDRVSTVLGAAVLGVVALRLGSGVRASRTRRGRSVVADVRDRIGWRHVWPVPLVLTAVVGAASA